MKNGTTLCTNAIGRSGVLLIATTDHHAIVEQHSCSYTKLGIGSVTGFGGLLGRFNQLAVGFAQFGIVKTHVGNMKCEFFHDYQNDCEAK